MLRFLEKRPLPSSTSIQSNKRAKITSTTKQQQIRIELHDCLIDVIPVDVLADLVIDFAIRGQVRIGTKLPSGQLPTYPDFEQIIVLTKSTAYGELGPYCLKDENGELIENAYQKSKVVMRTRRSIQKFPKSNRVIWDWRAEQHVDPVTKRLLPAWFVWSDALGKNAEPVRYPLTYDGRHDTLGCYSAQHCATTHISDLLDKPNARKKIYFPKYMNAAKKHPLFKKLQDKLDRGINLLLVDVDGPIQASLAHYKDKYGVGDDFIQQNTMLATEQNLKIMINDGKHSAGHCFGLASLLLGLEDSFLA